MAKPPDPIVFVVEVAAVSVVLLVVSMEDDEEEEDCDDDWGIFTDDDRIRILSSKINLRRFNCRHLIMSPQCPGFWICCSCLTTSACSD